MTGYLYHLQMTAEYCRRKLKVSNNFKPLSIFPAAQLKELCKDCNNENLWTASLHAVYNDFPPHTHSNQFLEIWLLSRNLFDVTRLLCKICCQFGQDLELREKKRLWDNPCLRSGLESLSSKLCHHGRFLLSTVPTKPLSFLSRAGVAVVAMMMKISYWIILTVN